LPLVAAAAPPAPTAPAADAVDAALAQAKQRHSPVLLDFHAPWCYACYFMTANVFTGEEWTAVNKRAVVVSLDVDTPEGAQRQAAMQVRGLPAYVVLDENGDEVGRLIGESTRIEFYRRIGDLLSRREPLTQLAASVRNGSAPSIVAARDVLSAYHARGDAEGGLAWWTALPPPVQIKLEKDAQVRLWTQRLRLQKASQANEPHQCTALAPPVFAGDLGCERPYEVERVMNCTASLPAAERKRLLSSQKEMVARLLYGRIFTAHPSCADARSTVLAEAGLDRELGYPKAEAAILDTAIADARKRLGGDLKRDRNIADNLRVYLERAGRMVELDALYPKLIAAYPDDYVYPYRYAKMLAGAGHYAEALHYYERAAPAAYGVNRLHVAQGRAEALLKLGRSDEAKTVAADALKVNGPWFPDEAAKLRATVSLPN
jgi:tetratricopeptide (TPR) repeat protein